MDKKPIIASTLTDHELSRAFTGLVAERWDNWDLSPFLVYMVDVCSPAILPYLADQFDVDGLQGFEMAETERQQRELIKKSLALHKYMGTPWAIREACRTVGFPVIILEEGITAADGIKRADDWARFRVLVHADFSKHITQEQARKIRMFVESYKNERSHLVELGFHNELTDIIFQNEKQWRDPLNLDIFTFLANPDIVTLDPDGSVKTTTIDANCDWQIEPAIIEWGDSSGDKIYFEYAGTAGESELKITSDYNRTGNRALSIDIFHPTGTLLGHLTIKQPLRWHNAYSSAYSNAYNLIPKKIFAYSRAHSDAYCIGEPYVRVSNKIVFLPPENPENDFYIYSNTDWEID